MCLLIRVAVLLRSNLFARILALYSAISHPHIRALVKGITLQRALTRIEIYAPAKSYSQYFSWASANCNPSRAPDRILWGVIAFGPGSISMLSTARSVTNENHASLSCLVSLCLHKQTTIIPLILCASPHTLLTSSPH